MSAYPKLHQLLIENKEWLHVPRDLSGTGIDGLNEPLTRTIILDSQLRGERHLDVLLHECMHAGLRELEFPYGKVEERYVTALSSSLAKTILANRSWFLEIIEEAPPCLPDS